MNRSVIILLAQCLVLGITCTEGRPGTPGKPGRFPGVGASDTNGARYVAISMDSWGGTVAYLLFDGTAKTGYTAIHAWIPGHARYDKPAKLPSAGANAFGPFTLESSNGKEKSKVAWTFSQTFQSHKGGTHTVKHKDYTTGAVTTRTVTRQASSTYILGYSVNFSQASTSDSIKAGGIYPMDMTLSARLGLSAWNKAKASAGLAPWQRLACYLSHTESAGRDANHSNVQLKYRSLGYSGGQCRVRSMPDNSSVTVVIKPYLEAPSYSNSFQIAELTGDGLSIELPYGWYTFGASRTQCGKFTYGTGFSSVRSNPYPLSKKVEAF